MVESQSQFVKMPTIATKVDKQPESDEIISMDKINKFKGFF